MGWEKCGDGMKLDGRGHKLFVKDIGKDNLFSVMFTRDEPFKAYINDVFTARDMDAACDMALALAVKELDDARRPINWAHEMYKRHITGEW